MRKLIYTLFALASITFIYSCTDLELFPEDGATEFEIFKDADAYRSYLAKAYGAYSLTGQDGPAGDADISIVNDEGFTSYIRGYWKAQELTTDEAVIAWTDAGIRDLHAMDWTSENQFVRVLYYRIAFIVSICNDFVRQSTDDRLDANGITGADRDVVAVYKAEARFLRALAYWHALDLFESIPLATEISTDFPTQASPQELFTFIENELKEIESVLPTPKSNEYGRADQAALWMLQAKLYQNAEVYIGENRYEDSQTAVNKVIAAGYMLDDKYQDMFLADNHSSPELIFTLPSDGKNIQNYGSTTFLVHGAIGGEMDPLAYGVGDGWAGLRATSALVDRFSGADGRAIFYTNGQSLDIEDIGEFTEGFAVPKYQNVTSSGVAGSDITFVDTDYPMFRLGDAYLMYAENVLRGASGTRAQAVDYINELRERAYGSVDGNITDADLDLPFILDERSRELYWEGGRRIDLRRYDEYTTSGIWPWKGDVKEGRTVEGFREIFPIPASDLIANPSLKQNEGY